MPQYPRVKRLRSEDDFHKKSIPLSLLYIIRLYQPAKSPRSSCAASDFSAVSGKEKSPNPSRLPSRSLPGIMLHLWWQLLRKRNRLIFRITQFVGRRVVKWRSRRLTTASDSYKLPGSLKTNLFVWWQIFKDKQRKGWGFKPWRHKFVLISRYFLDLLQHS